MLVRGLDRHLGLREAATRLQAERAAREERAFLLHPRGPPAPHTVPQPFALATEVGPHPNYALARHWYMSRRGAACCSLSLLVTHLQLERSLFTHARHP